MHHEQMKKRRKANKTVGIELRPEVESLEGAGPVAGFKTAWHSILNGLMEELAPVHVAGLIVRGFPYLVIHLRLGAVEHIPDTRSMFYKH